VSQVLNCGWVFLALWMLVHWVCSSRRQGPSRRLQLFGLICVLALLFPVISDNDDFLQQQVLSTPDSPVLKSLLNVSVVHENGTTPVRSACHAFFSSRAVEELVGCPSAVFLPAWSSGAIGDRSPPRVS